MYQWSYHGLRVALDNLPPSALAGSIQYRNASASIAAIESLDGGFALNEQTVSEALRNVKLAGRFQVVSGVLRIEQGPKPESMAPPRAGEK